MSNRTFASELEWFHPLHGLLWWVPRFIITEFVSSRHCIKRRYLNHLHSQCDCFRARTAFCVHKEAPYSLNNWCTVLHHSFSCAQTRCRRYRESKNWRLRLRKLITAHPRELRLQRVSMADMFSSEREMNSK